MAKYDLFVVGTGGTGTFFIKEFSRFLYGNRTPVRRLFLIDGDRVEAKNLERQAFEEEDIGRPKAQVLSEVLEGAFGLRWHALDLYLTREEEIRSLFQENTIPLVVGCVDNHACRLLLEKVFRKEKNIIYLDSANEFTAGEVVIAGKEKGRVKGACRSFYFPDILKGDRRDVTEMSCEELNHASPQHISVNMMAGNVLLSAVCRILDGTEPYGFISFDAEGFSMEFYPYKPRGKRKEAA